MATLIRIDKNGSKHYEGMVECPRCGGAGGRDVWTHTGWTCYKCGGTGKIMSKWIERTPEYQAKLDARRQAKLEAKQAEAERIRKEAEEQRLAEEARIKAQKAISQHVGEIGQRMTIKATYIGSAWYEVNAFRGYGTETRYIHMFKDEADNLLIWKTANGLGMDDERAVIVTGTVKEHTVYQDEKQTVLTRCKVEEA